MKKNWLKKVEDKLAKWSEDWFPIEYDPPGGPPLFFRGEIWILPIAFLALAVYYALYGSEDDWGAHVFGSLAGASIFLALAASKIKGPIGDRVRVWSSGIMMLILGSVILALLIVMLLAPILLLYQGKNLFALVLAVIVWGGAIGLWWKNR